MIIDVCIPDELKRSFDSFYKARVLIAILGLYFGMMTLISIWIFFIADASLTGKIAGAGICLLMEIGYITALCLFRFKNQFELALHITIGSSALGIVIGIIVSGGPVMAPATAMNIIPIIMAFVLIGKRAGLIWTQVIMTAHMSLMVAVAYGVNFMQLLTHDMLPVQHLAHWLITYSALIGLMFVFDTLNSRFRNEVNAERQKFEQLASHDPLTKLANRLQFDININQSISRSDRHKTMTALFFIDLDGFKPINDELGHDAGDIVLVEISNRLESSVRNIDTVARLGGDEFGVILEDIHDKNKLAAIANKLLRAISMPINDVIGKPSVSGSIGIAVYPHHAQNKDDLVKCADLAMYEAKKEKNRWAWYTTDLDENIQEEDPDLDDL